MPLKVGVVSLVMLSVLEVPLSVPAVMSGALGAATLASMVMARPEDATLVLPAVSVALAVMVWAPAARAEVVMVQLPEPSAVPDPISVVPSVSYSLTVALASAVPLKVGVVSLVMLSVLELPLSVPAVMSGALGAPGAVASMVTARPEDATLVLPAKSVALAVMVWAPADRAEVVMVQLPEPSAVPEPIRVVPSLSYSLTVALASAVPLKVVVLVILSVLEMPVSVSRLGALGAFGAVVSMVMARPVEATLVSLPTVALAVMVWAPADRAEVVMVQSPEPSAVPEPISVVPSVSYSLTVALAGAVPVKVGVVSLVVLSVLEAPLSVSAVMSGALGAATAAPRVKSKYNTAPATGLMFRSTQLMRRVSPEKEVVRLVL